MALSKRSVFKEECLTSAKAKSHSANQNPVKKPGDSMVAKRLKRRPERDFEEQNHSLAKGKSTMATLFDSSRKYGLSEEQDNELLIRETQAALKSLSGSWSDSRKPLYKINEQEPSPPSFQNLFEEKKQEQKMPIYSAADIQFCEQFKYNNSGGNNKSISRRRDLNNNKEDTSEMNKTVVNNNLNYHNQQTSDFTELVGDEDDSNEMEQFSEGAGGDSTLMRRNKDGNKLKRRNEHSPSSAILLLAATQNHQLHHSHHYPISSSSAFRPPSDVSLKHGMSSFPTSGSSGAYSANITLSGFPQYDDPHQSITTINEHLHQQNLHHHHQHQNHMSFDTSFHHTNFHPSPIYHHPHPHHHHSLHQQQHLFEDNPPPFVTDHKSRILKNHELVKEENVGDDDGRSTDDQIGTNQLSLNRMDESLDGKQYTILQPAKVDSKAAFVLQDLGRDNINLLPIHTAVSGLSSPLSLMAQSPDGSTSDSPSNTSSNDRLNSTPSFSPGSINRGEFNLKILSLLTCSPFFSYGPDSSLYDLLLFISSFLCTFIIHSSDF